MNKLIKTLTVALLATLPCAIHADEKCCGKAPINAGQAISIPVTKNATLDISVGKGSKRDIAEVTKSKNGKLGAEALELSEDVKDVKSPIAKSVKSMPVFAVKAVFVNEEDYTVGGGILQTQCHYNEGYADFADMAALQTALKEWSSQKDTRIFADAENSAVALSTFTPARQANDGTNLHAVAFVKLLINGKPAKLTAEDVKALGATPVKIQSAEDWKKTRGY